LPVNGRICRIQKAVRQEEKIMRATGMHDEIRELNLAYLMLAQQMLREDRAAAIYRLGVGEDIADVLEGLSSAQVLRMASSNMLLCQFRFNDTLLVDLLSSHGRERGAAHLHAAILAAGRPVESLV
jgi:flagellar transcriptional activator FlhD